MANLPNLTPRLLQNTLKLIKLYNTAPKFREAFDKLVPNPRVTYQGQPLKLYLRVITATSTKYRKYEKEVRADPEKFKELLIFFYKDPQGFSKFEKMVQASILGKYMPTFLTPEETELVSRIEQSQEEKEKGQLINQLEQKLKASQPKEEVLKATGSKETPKVPEEPKVSKESKEPEAPRLPQVRLPQITLPKPQLPKLPQPPHLTLPQIKFPSFTKDLLSQGQILARKVIYKFGANIFSGGVGGVVAAGLGGGPGGILAGGGLGAIFPNALKSSGIFRGGLAIGGKAAMGLGMRGASLAIPGPGWMAAVAMSAPDAIAAGKKIFSTTRRAAIIGCSLTLFLFLFMDFNKVSSVFPPFGSVGEAAPLPGVFPSNIASCEFTRAGASNPYQSSILLNWISSVAQKEGVPPAVFASVARHENPNFTTNADNNHDAIKSGYYYIVSQVNQDINKETNAVGLMQISTGRTPTPRGVVDHCVALLDSGLLKRAADKLGKKINEGGKNYYCVADVDERVKRFCQTNRTEKNKVYSTPDREINNTYFNLCNIEDNLAISAEKLKTDLGGGSWDKETDVMSVIRSYYGGCAYPSGDYCAEVWNDYQNCKVAPVPTMAPPQKEFALSCPINNEYNTCSNKSDSRDPCHCNPALGYDPTSMEACRKYPALEYGIDVGTKASKTALIPFITYQGETTPQSLSCELITEEPPTCPVPGSCEWQQTLRYQCPMKDNTLYLLYSHIKSNPGKQPQKLSSGEVVGEVANYGHGLRRLNIQAGVGGECSGTVVSTCKPGGDYFQCPLKKDYVLDY